jgi:4-hydroxy-tetrahydrodipicolinate reductase
MIGLPDQTLTICHHSGSSAEPYVAGTLVMIGRVSLFAGLRRGLEEVWR